MAQGYRAHRVGDQIREELSTMLTRGDVHDPRIGFITLTRVQVSADLQIARVYYTSLEDAAARRETQKALDRATPFLRRQIGARVRLRRVPEMEFRFDESIGHQNRIEQVLQDLHQAEAARAPAEPAASSEAAPGDVPMTDVADADVATTDIADTDVVRTTVTTGPADADQGDSSTSTRSPDDPTHDHDLD
jgi:ribosome-binding factor A